MQTKKDRLNEMDFAFFFILLFGTRSVIFFGFLFLFWLRCREKQNNMDIFDAYVQQDTPLLPRGEELIPHHQKKVVHHKLRR